MNEIIKIAHRTPTPAKITNIFTREEAERTKAFHSTLPVYSPTPLANLESLAKNLGVASFHVKDESKRFGLNAFKGLGGSYCLARYIAEKLGADISELPYDKLKAAKIDPTTFVTATDGNHGRGIAWAAHMFGQKAVVYMPKGSVSERLDNIRKLGAEASITDMNYDDTVRFAAECAKKHGWVLVQDTAWPGYEKIPGWVMQGYLTMALEAVESLKEIPTHVFLQAGVGSMAGAVAGFLADYYGGKKPIITIVEPNKADCIFRTARANDGQLHSVTGALDSIMAGLCCGEPCTIAWEMLGAFAEHFVSMPDYVAAKGMRVLGNPLGEDPRVISGESGASTTGFVCELMQNESLDYIRDELGMNEKSRVLCISTEGDTDRENYRRIVWDGLYPSF